MKTTFAFISLLGFMFFSNIAQTCDTIEVTMITHLYLGGPAEMEWDLEDEANGIDIMDGTHTFTISDSVFSFTACLDTGCYRARARFDNDIEYGMFEIWVTLNGDTLPVYDDIDYGDDDYKYYFPLHTYCQDDDQLDIQELAVQSKLFPNPADDVIYLEHPYLKVGSTVEVKNQIGKPILNLVVETTPIQLDCSQWPNGSYIISIKEDNYNSIIASKSIVSH